MIRNIILLGIAVLFFNNNDTAIKVKAFDGEGSGLLFISDMNNNELCLDIKCSEAKLLIIPDTEAVYASHYYEYKVKTTSGKTEIKYTTYSLANEISINIFDNIFAKSNIDGAPDQPIDGINFKSFKEDSIEYLSLIFEKDIVLDNRQFLFNSDPSISSENYDIWKNRVKQIKIIKNSVLFFAINKSSSKTVIGNK